jgi:D-sedoheptulose 7-phosphate isomerase
MTNIKQYFKNSSEVISALYKNEEKINLICDEILKTNKENKKLLVAGNGGSCSDAEHFTGELQCTYKDRDRKPISAISLGSHPAAFTAWSNDFGYETYFKRQVQAHGNPGDILFLISTGGGNEKNRASINLVEAAKEAKKKKMKIISLIGKTGGLLKSLSDLYILVENDITSHIQEAHISILHCICEIIDEKKSQL